MRVPSAVPFIFARICSYCTLVFWLQSLEINPVDDFYSLDVKASKYDYKYLKS